MMAGKPSVLLVRKFRRSIGAQYELFTPEGKHQCETAPFVSPSVDGKRLITFLPAVAVRAVMDATAVELFNAGDRRQSIDHARRQEKLTTPVLHSILYLNSKTALKRGNGGYFIFNEQNCLIGVQLRTGSLQEFSGCDAVTGEIAVHGVGRGVAL